jgi:hypothetical protein
MRSVPTSGGDKILVDGWSLSVTFGEGLLTSDKNIGTTKTQNLVPAQAFCNSFAGRTVVDVCKCTAVAFLIVEYHS